MDSSTFVPGVTYDEPESTYFQRELGVASNSVLKMIDSNVPAYYKAWIDGRLEEKSSAAFEVGHALHCRVLEPDKFAKTYIDTDRFGDMRSSTNRATRDAYLDANPGVVSIKQRDLDMVERMYESMMRKPLVEAILSRGKREVVVRWIDPTYGVHCKSRVDYYEESLGLALDLKSVMSASHWKFGSSVYEYSYHTQHCMYSDGCKANDLPLRGFVFLLCEKTAPYLSALRKIDAAAEERGFEQLYARLEKFKKIIDDGTFEGYPDAIEEQSIPGYAFSNRS